MPRSQPHREVRRGKVRGHGRTMRDATLDLQRKIDLLCEHFVEPEIEVRHGLFVIVWITPDGWNYQLLDPAKAASNEGRTIWCSNMAAGQYDRSEVVEQARRHAAHNGWSRDVTDDEAFIARSGLSPAGITALRRWVAFQREYARLEAAGYSPNDCHRLAALV